MWHLLFGEKICKALVLLSFGSIVQTGDLKKGGKSRVMQAYACVTALESYLNDSYF